MTYIMVRLNLFVDGIDNGSECLSIRGYRVRRRSLVMPSVHKTTKPGDRAM